ncbi:DUF1415 domain-containing protein [Comamonas kerstersii]|uniref:Peptidase n=1 Tax=Comamonas kerstersii TaxID=225992 RepID=A0A0W7Z0E7_9BURK|nr:DUF1415 domain-containing protein [Comamonas kerstersii]MDO4969550.1 DUF1415 domain-containing protein [Comamonadaceae bacterium]AQZ98163.1 peptidase [Comamonas kerstersii]KAB0588756.1 DUF1415 domain-containing protein [Comamonas kerstersii]KUF40628.1 peptidase [Comamonas kerstersii]OOH86913.1 peptidase [Comamonas kerstersii]
MTDTTTDRSFPEDIVIADTVRWLEKAVIGLNLCPFAKSVHVKGQIHYVVSQATDAEGVAMDLHRELEALAEISPEKRDTTLLILPQALQDFLDFNDFLEIADAMVEELDLGGILQVASFHPLFQFEGTDVDDVTNCTNRAPYPTLHLLREDSIDKAVEAFPEAEMIYERNMKVLEDMGIVGWLDLDVAARCPVTGHGPEDKH